MKTYSTGEIISRRQIDGMDSEDWVPANVAKFMLDTLKVVLSSGEWFDGSLEFNSYDTTLPGEELESLVQQAIAAADGDEHD